VFTRHYPHWPPGVPKTVAVPDVTLWDNLAGTAARLPEKLAFAFYDGELSFRRLRDQAEALAGDLIAAGVKPGDRVVLFLQNSPQFVLGYYAVLRADAVVVPANPMSKTEELRHYAEDSGARHVIASQDLLPQLQPLLGECLDHCLLATYSDYVDPATNLAMPDIVRAPRLAPEDARIVPWHAALAAGRKPPAPRAKPDDLAVLPYTSGTTGKPKGCMLSHRNLMANCAGGIAWSGTPQPGVVLSSLPMFHLTGMQAGMNSPILRGSTVVLMARWDRDTAAKIIAKRRVTSWTAITTMMVDFLANPELGRYDLSSIERVGGGGAAMPEAVARQVETMFRQPFVEGYGLTETAAPSHSNPVHRPKRQCGGIPFINTDARVIDPETRQERGPGETGEIIVHGPQVFSGYWRRPEATAEAFIEHDGKRFFRTGDLGYYDDEGYFFITDRLKRMINASGFKVWPAEVEAMLYDHPAIREACVIAARDPRRGETVKAVVVLKPEAQGKTAAEDIVAWARTRMAEYKYPRLVEFVDALPKTGTGKVFWRQLQERENARRTE